MRFQTVSAVGGSEYAGSRTPEKVFGVFRNGATATATGGFAVGEPVILATASVSVAGVDITSPAAADSDVNNLFVGVVADYPGQPDGGSWKGEDYGLVQVYGLHTAAVLAIGTDALSAGAILQPTTSKRLAPVSLYYGQAATSTSNHATRAGVAGLVVLYENVAASTAAGTTAAKVFIRAM